MSLKTGEYNFCITRCGDPLMGVGAEASAIEALELAEHLACGISLLCEKLYDSINERNDLVYSSEIRAIGFLGEAASALVGSVSRAMPKEKQDGQ